MSKKATSPKGRVEAVRVAVLNKMGKRNMNIDDLRDELNNDYLFAGTRDEKGKEILPSEKVGFSTLWRFLYKGAEPKAELAYALFEWSVAK